MKLIPVMEACMKLFTGALIFLVFMVSYQFIITKEILVNHNIQMRQHISNLICTSNNNIEHFMVSNYMLIWGIITLQDHQYSCLQVIIQPNKRKIKV